MSHDRGVVFEADLGNNKNDVNQTFVMGLLGEWPITPIDVIQNSKLYTGTLIMELPTRIGNTALDAAFFKLKQDHVLKAIDVWYTGKEDDNHRLLDSTTASVGIYVSNQKEGGAWRERLFLVVKDYCAKVSDNIKRELKSAAENNQSVIQRHKLELIDVTEKTLLFTRLVPEKQREVQSQLVTWKKWSESIKTHQKEAKKHLKNVADRFLSALKLNVGHSSEDRIHIQWENCFKLNNSAGVVLYSIGSPIIDRETHAVIVRNAPLEGFSVFACVDKTISKEERKSHTGGDEWLSEYNDIDAGIDMQEYFGMKGAVRVESAVLSQVQKDHTFYKSVIKDYDAEAFEKTLSKMNESEKDVFYHLLHDFSRMNMLEGWDKPLMLKNDASTSGDCRVPGIKISSKIPEPSFEGVFRATTPDDLLAYDKLKAMKRARETLREVTRSMKQTDLKFFPTEMMDTKEWKALKKIVPSSAPFVAKVSSVARVGERRMFYRNKDRLVVVNGSLVLVTKITGAAPCAVFRENVWLELEKDLDDASYAELSKFAQNRKSDNRLMTRLRPLVLVFGA